jgi:hypothetical protein
MYKIDAKTVEALLSYLAQRPYIEVSEGIKALQSLEPIEE